MQARRRSAKTVSVSVAGIADADGITQKGGANDFHFQWQYLDIALGDWVPITDPHDSNPLLASNGATSASFTPSEFFLGQQLRAIVSYTDGLGFTESITSAPTPGLLDITRDAAGNPVDAAGNPTNTSPFVEQAKELDGFGNTAAQQDHPINGMFLPLLEVFNDRETAANKLTYKAEIVDSSGVAHLITGNDAAGNPNVFMGLHFTVDTVPDPAGPAGAVLVTDGHITGTPPAGFSGAITVRITATDAGTPLAAGGFLANTNLSAINEFNIDVQPAANHAPVFNPAVFAGQAFGGALNNGFNENTTTAVLPANNNNTPAGTLVSTLSAIDALTPTQLFGGIAASQLAWSIANTDALTQGLFALGIATDLVTATGTTSTETLKFLTAPDFEQLKLQLAATPNPNVTVNAAGTEITFKVQVQVSDGELTATQTEIVRIENVDETPTGQIHITGAAAVPGAALLTALDAISVSDLITAANLTGALTGENPFGTATPYQWQGWDGAVWTDILGATSATFSVANRTVRVTASYTDPFGPHDPSTDPALLISPEVYIIGDDTNNIFSGFSPAGLFANGHDRTFVGLGGNDTVSYAGDTLGLTINLFDPTRNTGIALGDNFVSIENFIGGSSNDTFVAAADNAANTFDGNLGDNTYDLSSTSASATINMVTGLATSAQIGVDTLINIQNIVGSTANDTFIAAGNGLANTFDGGLGNNTYDLSSTSAAAAVNMVTGAATSALIGTDSLFHIQNIVGSTVNDTFIAVADNVLNQFDGGTGTDTIDFSGLGLTSALNIQGFNSVNNNFQTVIGSGATGAADQIRHIENFVGGQAGNIITVNDNVGHIFTGGAGVDQFTFGQGGDTVVATIDNVRDVYNGAGGTNTADYSAYAANLSLNLRRRRRWLSGRGHGIDSRELRYHRQLRELPQRLRQRFDHRQRCEQRAGG